MSGRAVSEESLGRQVGELIGAIGLYLGELGSGAEGDRPRLRRAMQRAMRSRAFVCYMEENMSPTIGRIVLVKLKEMGQPVRINGAEEFPAIVTAVHSETMINCRVLQDDGAVPRWETSIPHVDAAEGYSGSTWRWPPRD